MSMSMHSEKNRFYPNASLTNSTSPRKFGQPHPAENQ